MTELRRLTDDGISSFRLYIEQLTDGSDSDPPYDLLRDPASSDAIAEPVMLERVDFATKRDAAEWLDGKLAVFSEADLFSDTGLWSALALWFFDALAPADENGHRNPGRDVYYIPQGTWHRDYRHKLLAPYRVYRLHGDGANVILEERLEVHGDWMEQLASRIEVVTNPVVMEAVDRLYFDEERNSPKRGAQTRGKPGTLRRFIGILQQLDLTYDMHSLEAKDLLELLPAEFDRFKR